MTTIRGVSGGKPATLEVTGDTLTWRGFRPGPPPGPDNLATTIHDVKDVAWLERRWSAGGLGIVLLSGVWMASESLVVGGIGLAIGGALVARALRRPTLQLLLVCGDRRLLLDVDALNAIDARDLASRIRHVLITGGAPASPPTLP